MHHGTWKRLGDGTLLTQDADEGLGHIVPKKVYMNILLTLMFLTIVTVAASRWDFGAWNTVIAMVIASVKALLVALFFMHLKFEGKVVIMYAIYPLILLFLLIGGTVRDVEKREHPVPSNAQLAAEPTRAPVASHDTHH